MNAHNSSLESWDEIRTAYHVARLGTLSAAATHLGVHHATVIRHIDALETRLSSKLFHRHARGYTPTEAGHDLLQVASATDDQLSQLAGRLRGKSTAVEGEIVVTTLAGLSPQITPLLVAFQQEYPDVRVTLITDDRPLRMDHGEAHIAIRAGSKPQEPDNVVTQLARIDAAPFAHKDYVAQYGMIKGETDLANHQFVAANSASARAPTQRWMADNVPDDVIIYRASDMRSLEDAVHAGAGIGLISLWSGRSNPDLVQMMPSRPEWVSVLWLVTHMDLHRTTKVQAMHSFLKANIAETLDNLGNQGEP